MFEGRYDHALDAKGRTMVPKPFREHLEKMGDLHLRLTKGMGSPRRIEVRTNSSFDAYRKRLAQAPETALIRRWKQFYIQNSVRIELDTNGRLLVPARLRRWCDLGDKLSFVGLDEERFELWRPEDFDLDDNSFTDDWETSRDQLAALGL